MGQAKPCTIRACKKYNDFEGATGINNSRNVRFNIYTLQNYNLLGEYINGVEENNEIFFDIEVSTSVDTRNFANIMLLAMLAASFLQSLKWAKSAFLSAYALSPNFRII